VSEAGTGSVVQVGTRTTVTASSCTVRIRKNSSGAAGIHSLRPSASTTTSAATTGSASERFSPRITLEWFRASPSTTRHAITSSSKGSRYRSGIRSGRSGDTGTAGLVARAPRVGTAVLMLTSESAPRDGEPPDGPMRSGKRESDTSDGTGTVYPWVMASCEDRDRSDMSDLG
jgi:hypothetical protein